MIFCYHLFGIQFPSYWYLLPGNLSLSVCFPVCWLLMDSRSLDGWFSTDLLWNRMNITGRRCFLILSLFSNANCLAHVQGGLQTVKTEGLAGLIAASPHPSTTDDLIGTVKGDCKGKHMQSHFTLHSVSNSNLYNSCLSFFLSFFLSLTETPTESLTGCFHHNLEALVSPGNNDAWL